MTYCESFEPLAARVLEAARSSRITLGCAESCTGGSIAAALTDIAGSSDVFVGGVVSYWAEVKERLLNVEHACIEEHGVVSEQVAQQMAQGARKALGCDVAVSTTGIAGPGGAEPGKPVGTVCLALSSPNSVQTWTIHATGSRAEVRVAATNEALAALLEFLEAFA